MSESTAVDGTLYATGYSGVAPVDLAQYLKRTFTADETASAFDLIKSVEYELASKCHRNFNTDLTYFEYFNGGRSVYSPSNYPVASLTKIEVDGIDITDNHTLGATYWILGNDLRFYTPVYSSHLPFNAVRLEYIIKPFWGDDVKLMVKKWAGVNFLNAENGGVPLSSFSFADLSQTFSYSEFTKERDALIARYEDILV
jgi:hypothetical protein